MDNIRVKEVQFLAWLFCGALLLVATNQCATRTLPDDFVYFYSIGKILNEHSPERLYDAAFQQSVFNQIAVRTADKYGPSPYPPFLALTFKPFAVLSFQTAYRCWAFISFGLYLSALLMLVRRFCAGSRTWQSLLVCLGLSLWTFLGRTLVNGQISTIGFFAIALAIYLEDARQPYWAGVSLAACAYKPTLLLLILPMLLLTHRTKVFAGFIVALSGLALFTTIVLGTDIWPAYLRFSRSFAEIKGFVASDYVDIRTFAVAAAHGFGFAQFGILAMAVIGGIALVVLWWRSAGERTSLPAQFIWGTTVTWSLLLNVYTPLYDTILIVASLVLTRLLIADFSRRLFIATCVLTVALSYVTQAFAELTGVQLLTLFLAALGALQIVLCLRWLRFRSQLSTATLRQATAYAITS